MFPSQLCVVLRSEKLTGGCGSSRCWRKSRRGDGLKLWLTRPVLSLKEEIAIRDRDENCQGDCQNRKLFFSDHDLSTDEQLGHWKL